jgi:hypothetical protein
MVLGSSKEHLQVARAALGTDPVGDQVFLVVDLETDGDQGGVSTALAVLAFLFVGGGAHGRFSV